MRERKARKKAKKERQALEAYLSQNPNVGVRMTSPPRSAHDAPASVCDSQSVRNTTKQGEQRPKQNKRELHSTAATNTVDIPCNERGQQRPSPNCEGKNNYEELRAKKIPQHVRKVRRGADVSRANLPVKGHSSSDGIPYNSNIAEIVDKINECPRQSSSSSSQSIKRDQTALVSGSEHSESSSFDMNSKTHWMVLYLLGEVSVLKHRHDKLASFIASELNQNNSLSKCGTKCKLLDWVDSSKIVAEGEIAVEDPTYRVEGIGTPLGRGACLVEVERILEPTTFVWKSQFSMITIKSALGLRIPWPKDCILVPLA
ncbi:hypothetical protein Syun_010806 [Stephania yunnanensis]|uniref:Transposase Tnp1/En/Spm-like domain-containing protein n=1 Tax=Stephania yunnanensis TaxID=152371 RepID=A0AAP0PQA7_9MAGN